ncbi:MAG: Lrp/AsnC family transcriptional regulator [Actinomycetota bacterium]|nr:Lrp/AsnC family transcriptional regulator [Actinomycetota bacterium]
MDQIDRQLVEALRADARASYAQLARLVGLSAPSVQDRVRRLERRGIITGYHAAVDPIAAGLAVTALVGVHQTDSAELADVAERLSAVTEVEDCFFVAGDNAFIVKVRVPDVAGLEATIGRLQRVDGVARTRTTVVLSTKWEHRQVPVPVPVPAPVASPEAEPVRPADPPEEMA